MTKNIIRSDDECQRILDEMWAAGKTAADGYMRFRPDTGTCGFAEVVISKAEISLRRTTSSPFPRRLSYRGEMPSMLARCGSYQSIDAAESVAKAMAESLLRNGVDAHVRSRMD